MGTKIAFLGAGAIGGVMGGSLSRAGHDITLIDTWPAHIEKIQSDGIKVTTVEEEFVANPTALHIGEITSTGNQYDVVFLSVKSYDTRWMSTLIEPHIAPGGTIVSAQNSINEDIIASVVGWSRTMGCVVTIGATTRGPGHVERTSSLASKRSFTLGDPSNADSPRIHMLTDILSDIGETGTTKNLLGERWAKIATNSMANSVSGVTGQTSQGMRNHPVTRDLSIMIATEVVNVAKAHGVEIGAISGIPSQMFLDAERDQAMKTELEAEMVESGKKLGDGIPSLAQDISKGRRTEIDYLNGYVIDKGREAGVPTPMNEAILDLTKRVESGELVPHLDNIWLIIE